MAKDILHNIVETALIKDGWINIKSMTLDYEEIDLNNIYTTVWHSVI
jgi:hypothetical protein